MSKPLKTGVWVSAALLGLAVSSVQAAPIIFDNFNVDEGHFGYSPTFSSTSVGEDASSTADRDTATAFEGAASQRLVIVDDPAVATAVRIRHLSGGPPYNAANAGTPVGNTGFSFTTGAGEDGWIGFYVKTSTPDWNVSINLDGPGNTAAEMDGSAAINLIADGEWHLYEWNLDATGWGAVAGIGGGHSGVVANGSHTIDSIYFRTASGAPATGTFYLDFVAKTDSGSVAALVPEPGSIAVLGLAGMGLFRRRRH